MNMHSEILDILGCIFLLANLPKIYRLSKKRNNLCEQQPIMTKKQPAMTKESLQPTLHFVRQNVHFVQKRAFRAT